MFNIHKNTRRRRKRRNFDYLKTVKEGNYRKGQRKEGRRLEKEKEEGDGDEARSRKWERERERAREGYGIYQNF